MQAPRIALRLLGDARLTAADRVIIDREWPRRKAAAILKLLALSPESARHREWIMEQLWPDLAPSSAANQLYKGLHAIRSATRAAGLAEPIVTVGGEVVRLSPEVEIDVRRFESLALEALRPPTDERRIREALDAYGGDLLPDDPFSEWADAPREALRALCRRLRLAEVDVLLSAGDESAAVGLLESLVADEPWLEDAHRRLISLHLDAGRRAAALRQYRSCRDALRRELAAEPGPEIERLVRSAIEAAAAEPAERDGSRRIELIERLADVERRTGDVRRSAQLYGEALEAARRTGNADAVARLSGKAALGHILDGDVESAAPLLDELRDSLARETPAYLTARTHYLLAQLRWHSGRYVEALDAAEASLAAARTSNDAAQRARALEILALACHALGDWQRGLEAEMERAALDLPDGFDVAEAFEGHACLWEYHLYGDRPYAATESTVRALLARAEAAGNRRATALSLLTLGSVLFLTGDWSGAEASLRRAMTVADAVGAEQASVQSEQRLGLLETSRGELDGGWQLLRSALDRASRSASAQVQFHSRTRILASIARNRLQAGDVAAAVTALDHAALVQEQVGECVTCDATLHPTAVPVLLAAGSFERARAASARAGASASAFGSRGWSAAAAHAEGLVALASGGGPSARRHLVRASRMFSELGQPFDEARSVEALAAAMARNGATSEARTLRRLSGEGYAALGAAPGSDRLDLFGRSGKVGGRSPAAR